MSETHKIALPKDGSVAVTVEPKVTEKEIAEDRQDIVIRLHAAYLNLLDEMKEFQDQWDADPASALLRSAGEGLYAGGGSWVSDQADLFKAQTWTDLGKKISGMAGDSYDILASYAVSRYRDLQKDVNKYVDQPEDTLYNFAWWQTEISAKAEELLNRQAQRLRDAKADVEAKAKHVLDDIDKSRKIYQHRDEILNVPTLIAQGDVRAIQGFVDTVVRDIDPELYQSIRHSENFYVVLEIIADHESALTYVSYVSLAIEAVPPNFYAYLSGKAGAYLLIEAVLLLVTALLSAGTAAAARLSALAVRIATASGKLANAGKQIKRARAAIDAYVRVLEDYSHAVQDLHKLGAKLRSARARGLVKKGSTKTTLKLEKESIKREKKCRFCGSTKHATPRIRLGMVEYD